MLGNWSAEFKKPAASDVKGVLKEHLDTIQKGRLHVGRPFAVSKSLLPSCRHAHSLPPFLPPSRSPSLPPSPFPSLALLSS